MQTQALDRIGVRRGAPAASTCRDYLDTYEAVLSRAPATTIVLLLNDAVAPTANTFAEGYPDAAVHVMCPPESAPLPEDLLPSVHVTGCPSLREVRDALRLLPRPQLIVESWQPRPVLKRTALVHMPWFLASGGTYAIEDLDGLPGSAAAGRRGSVAAHVGRIARVHRLGADAVPTEAGWAKAAGAAVSEVRIRGSLALLTYGGRPYQFALRHTDADAVLAARYADGAVVDVIERRDAYTFESRAELAVHGTGPDVGRTSYEVPPRTLRRYHEVDCYPRQLARMGDFWLPDTFRHFAHQRLVHRKLERATPHFHRLVREPREPRGPRRLDGEYFYVDTELCGHFGHVTTEVLGRFWAWPRALQENPEIKVLASHYANTPPRFPSFQREMFAAFGIDDDRVEFISPGETVRVESLVAATPQFENPQVIDGDITQTWAALSAGLPQGRSPVEADKIFVSRRPSGKRDCLETPAVEEFFASRGFVTVFPEDLPYWQQVRTFERARVIAGFGGSGMFSMMFAPHARIIVISGSAYTAQNEYLFAAANGNEIHYFWGDSIVPRGDHWNPEAFRSNFTFDLRAHHDDLVAATR